MSALLPETVNVLWPHDKDVPWPVSHVLLSRCRGFLALLLLTAATIFSGAGASTAHWDYTGLHFTEDQIQPKHLILTVLKHDITDNKSLKLDPNRPLIRLQN